ELISKWGRWLHRLVRPSDVKYSLLLFRLFLLLLLKFFTQRFGRWNEFKIFVECFIPKFLQVSPLLFGESEGLCIDWVNSSISASRKHFQIVCLRVLDY